MASHLNPYISFTGNARQAMAFYQEALGGALDLMTVADVGAPDAPNADAVMHARLDMPDGSTLMAWDVAPGEPHHPGSTVALYLGGDDEALRDRFAALSEGGTITMPLEPQAWGDEAGALVDRFGITWMVNITRRRS